jgi:class 3 adenylate cyclase
MVWASPDITLPKVRESQVRNRAILFADVCKSTVLHEQLGDRAAQLVINRLLTLASKAVRSHGGHVVKTIGDEILAVLPNADAAAHAACDLMLEIDSCRPQSDIAHGMHVGFHAGTFIERDGDVFGDAVNVASRLTAYARSGQVLTTSSSAYGFSPLLRRSMRKLGALDIRGKREEMEVEEIGWQDGDSEEVTLTESVPHATLAANSRLVLHIGERKWIVGPQARHLTIGRDPCADIAIKSVQASRNHGFIEYRNGSFFYADKSLNGSYVSFRTTGESLVRRSQVLLSGQGVICFGYSVHETEEKLEFHIERTAH